MTSPAPIGPTSGVTAFDLAPLATAAIWDDFNGPYGTKPNPALWLLDTTNQGGYQSYTTDNVYLDGSGHLVLKAAKSGNNYLSGRITSRTKFNMQHGRVSASIKFPSGPGFHCAFWMLGIGYPNVAGNPPCGEIDIQETFNAPLSHQSSLITHAAPGSTGGAIRLPTTGWDYKSAGPDLSQDFHEYWLEWTTDSITVGMDAATWGTWAATDLVAGMSWADFQKPLYVIMNFALESYLSPVDPTKLPAQMLIDWFRYTPWN